MPSHARFDPARFRRLNDPARLETQVGDKDLARLLGLRGDEDVIDLGSGTGFYTDRIAALTTGTVYAVELQPEMNDHYRERGLPGNVRLIPGDITSLPMRPHPATSQTDAGFLRPGSADVACSIATWHETSGSVDLPALQSILRPHARVIIIDWRSDPESYENGPPQALRSSKHEVAAVLAPYFPDTHTEDLGRFMFAVVARR